MVFEKRAMRLWIVIGIILMAIDASAQNPTVQDCLGAIPVCEQIYREEQVLDGPGEYANEVNGDFSCLVEDNRGIWYTFTVNSSGDFGFLLTPNDPDDDYDWALFNITNARCEDIRRDPGLLVSCNASGSAPGDSPNCNGPTGATGQSNFDVQGGNCGNTNVNNDSGRTPFNDLISVVQGNTYALFVANWSQSTNGYEIDFGFSGNIGIIDQTPPEIKSIEAEEADGCSPNFLDITFTELIKCSSIATANFSLSDDQGNAYSVELISGDCSLGASFSREYRLDVLETLPIGSYNLKILGSPTFSILDPCDNEKSEFNFQLEINRNALSDIAFPTDTVACDVASITIDAFDDQATDYMWQDGSTSSDLTITQSGTYSVQVSNECDMKVGAIDVLILDNRNAVVVDLGLDTSLCLGESYLIDPQLDSDLEFSWSDGNTGATNTVTNSATYELIVSDACGELGSDEVDVDFKDIPIEIDLGERTAFCTGDVVNLDATNVNAADYLWSDGSTDPILVVSTTGTYSVVVSNECSSDMDEIIVNESACVDCNVYLPNIISLSSQTGNSNFEVVSNCPFISYSIEIFDRWGGLMYTSNDQSQLWGGITNGQPVISGSYAYIVKLSYIEFDELIEEDHTGTITVIQ